MISNSVNNHTLEENTLNISNTNPCQILIHSFHRKARKSLADLHPEGSKKKCRHLRDNCSLQELNISVYNEV